MKYVDDKISQCVKTWTPGQEVYQVVTDDELKDIIPSGKLTIQYMNDEIKAFDGSEIDMLQEILDFDIMTEL
mgnify:CR=1 FL=1